MFDRIVRNFSGQDKHLEAFMTFEKIQNCSMCRKYFPLEALLVTQPPNVVPPKGNASAQAAIMDFLYRFSKGTSFKHEDGLSSRTPQEFRDLPVNTYTICDNSYNFIIV